MGVQNFTTGNVLTASDINTYLSNSDGIGRNLIHNGAMQVHQRVAVSTGVTGITTTGYYSADRWRFSVSGLGTWTQSVEADGPTSSGLTKSLKMLVTTANAAPTAALFAAMEQRIEGQNLQRINKGTASALQLTLSFWVKSNVTGTYIAELFDQTNTRQVSASYTISASATWERKTITFPADTSGAMPNDNTSAFQVRWFLGVGSNYTSGTLNTAWAASTDANRAVGQTNVTATINNYWQVTGVQLEVGATAGPFEFEDYSQTLRKCQRYYFRQTVAANARFGAGFNQSTTVARGWIPYPVTMRSAPSALEQSGTAGDYAIGYLATGAVCTSVPTHSVASPFGAEVTFTAGAVLTAGQGSILYAVNATGYLGWSADL